MRTSIYDNSYASLVRIKHKKTPRSPSTMQPGAWTYLYRDQRWSSSPWCTWVENKELRLSGVRQGIENTAIICKPSLDTEKVSGQKMEVEKLQMLFHAMKGDIDSPKAQCTSKWAAGRCPFFRRIRVEYDTLETFCPTIVPLSFYW
jgi:hypothetical protein